MPSFVPFMTMDEFSHTALEEATRPTDDRSINSTLDSTAANMDKPANVAPNVKPGQLAAPLRTAVSKKKKKKMRPGAPAKTIMRGFHTPVTSGAEDSDCSTIGTPRSGFAATPSTASPSVRASSLTRAISELKLHSPRTVPAVGNGIPNLQLDEALLDDDASDRTTSDKFEIPLVRDFASEVLRPKSLYAIEGGLRHESPHRKMTASDFEPLKCLGKGAFGTVLLVRQHSTGRLFAQKQLKKASLTVEQRLVDQTKTERAILESVNRHPFVVKLFYAFQDRKKLYLILEYAQGGELFHHLAMERTFSEEVSAFYMAEMVLALDHLHRNLGVVYRDLKPENCLLDASGHLLLTDFGLSKVAAEDSLGPGSATKCNSFSGTIDYMAPEVIQGKEYDQAVDWWSLGALGFDLLTGSPPFSANNHTKTQQKIVQGKLNPPYYLSPDAKDILIRLLRKDPKKRLGGNMPKDLDIIKGHRFFRRLDWKALANRDIPAPIQPIITDPAAAENFDDEFTGLAMSPVEQRLGKDLDLNIGRHSRLESFGSVDEQFGGFSYVASGSLLDFEL